MVLPLTIKVISIIVILMIILIIIDYHDYESLIITNWSSLIIIITMIIVALSLTVKSNYHDS